MNKFEYLIKIINIFIKKIVLKKDNYLFYNFKENLEDNPFLSLNNLYNNVTKKIIKRDNKF